MDLIEKSVLEYIDLVDSRFPTPGGGSVASLAGALGVSLAKMLGHFSYDKKKFKEASEKKKNQFLIAFEKMDYYKDILVKGIDDDAISYNSVAEAMKRKDEENLQKALLTSTYVAFSIQENAYYALKCCKNLIELGNKFLYSDLISAAILLNSCVEMASLNVIANAKMLSETTIKEDYLLKTSELIQKSKRIKNLIIREIRTK